MSTTLCVSNNHHHHPCCSGCHSYSDCCCHRHRLRHTQRRRQRHRRLQRQCRFQHHEHHSFSESSYIVSLLLLFLLLLLLCMECHCSSYNNEHNNNNYNDNAIINNNNFLIPFRIHEQNHYHNQPHYFNFSNAFIIRGIFLLLGIGILIPWNAFISATQYFDSRLRCTISHDNNNNATTNSNSTSSASATISNDNFESIFAILFNLSSVVSLGLLILLQSLQPSKNKNKTKKPNHNHHQQQQEQQQEQQKEQQLQQQHKTLPQDPYDVLYNDVGKIIDTIVDDDNNDINNNTNIIGNINSSNNVDVDVDHDNGHHEHHLVGTASSSKSKSSSTSLVIVPLTIYVIVFLMQAFMTLFIHIDPTTFGTLTISSLVLCGTCSVLAQSGIVATAASSTFSSTSTNLAMSSYLQGQAYGGVAVSIANFVAATWSDPGTYWLKHCSNSSNNNINNNSTSTDLLNYMDGSSVAGSRSVQQLLVVSFSSSSSSSDNNNGLDHSILTALPTNYNVDTTTNTGILSQESSSGDKCIDTYNEINWGVFVYFFAGSITLIACLFGYMYVHTLEGDQIILPVVIPQQDDDTMQNQHHQHQQQEQDVLPNDYETVQSHENLEELIFPSSQQQKMTTTTTIQPPGPENILLTRAYSNGFGNGLELPNTIVTVVPNTVLTTLRNTTSTGASPMNLVVLNRISDNSTSRIKESTITTTTTNKNDKIINTVVGGGILEVNITNEIDNSHHGNKDIYNLRRRDHHYSYSATTTTDDDELLLNDEVDGNPNRTYTPRSTTEIANSSSSSSGNTTYMVWNLVQGPAICIYLTFLVTLSLFPGLTSQLTSAHQCNTGSDVDDSSGASGFSRIYNDLYTPFTFVLFNLGDLFGRIVSSYVPIERIPNLSSKLIILAGCRLIFIPLLLSLCSNTNIDTNNDDHHRYSSSNIHNDSLSYLLWDVYSLLIQWIFAVTNGLVLSMAFVYAPNLIPRDNIEMQEKMSEMLNFAISIGLLSGSLLSYPVSKAV